MPEGASCYARTGVGGVRKLRSGCELLARYAAHLRVRSETNGCPRFTVCEHRMICCPYTSLLILPHKPLANDNPRERLLRESC